MEELTIEEEATALFEVAIGRMKRRGRRMAVYYSDLKRHIVVTPLNKFGEKTRKLLKNQPEKFSGIYGAHSERGASISEIAALIERSRAWPKTPTRRRKQEQVLDAHLIAPTPEQWREANWPLMVRLGGQTNVT